MPKIDVNRCTFTVFKVIFVFERIKKLFQLYY